MRFFKTFQQARKVRLDTFDLHIGVQNYGCGVLLADIKTTSWIESTDKLKEDSCVIILNNGKIFFSGEHNDC